MTLQQKQKGKWIQLPASVPMAHDGCYSLGNKLGLKGKNDLCIVSGTVSSQEFNLTVR
ncbi:hypothetical protein ACGFX8_34000 [Streptomyces sp. NPDC048362]|uniref:hypothetical protein n=1 Tax=Streptomyces sp. NPDC048362 TaxID=3365539 RepID=UPI003711ECA8